MRSLTSYRRKYLYLKICEARRKLKAQAVEYKGGACSRCGFTGSAAAFDFHHLDPKKKDFGISRGYRSFERIKAELDKTILLCSNCHRTIHEEEATANYLARLADFKALPPPKKGRQRINAR